MVVEHALGLDFPALQLGSDDVVDSSALAFLRKEEDAWMDKVEDQILEGAHVSATDRAAWRRWAEGGKRGRRGRRSCRRLPFPLFWWVGVPANMQRQVPAVLKTSWVSSFPQMQLFYKVWRARRAGNDRCIGPDSAENCPVSAGAALQQGSHARVAQDRGSGPDVQKTVEVPQLQFATLWAARGDSTGAVL